VVTARIRSFEVAERARDAEALVAHYASLPEFYFSVCARNCRTGGLARAG
jgi:hypothetical protein